ncbi:WXG100 family type VII secretion target [Clostridium akagii]|uniref:WXG100 family type VII secretion target n=1 Tax=Clostridium akagii TaxID=91623 RepID=UPI0004793D49|nr:WXG100 family type VII secretion target [Clostridium akagii]
MYEIKMQSDVVQQVANNFLNESQEITDMLNRINGYVNELSTSWVGDSKNKFVEELNSQTVNNLNAYVEHFSKLGNSLAQIVAMFQQTDASDGSSPLSIGAILKA